MKILGFSSQYNKNQDHSRTFAILMIYANEKA
jgi:hypothetical protein